MTFKTAHALALAAGVLVSASAFAQPAMIGETVSVAPSSTGNELSFDYDGGAGVVGGSMTFASSDPNLTITGLTCSGAFTCPAQVTGTVAFLSLQLQEVADTDDAVVVTFDVGAAAPPQTHMILVQNEQYSDAGSMAVAPSGTVNGTVNVSSGPAPGNLTFSPDPVALSAPVNGSDNATVTLTNSNGAGDDDITGLSCNYTGDSAITVGAPASTTIAANGGTTTASASCSSGSAGNFTGTYACTFAGGGAASVAVNCTVANGQAGVSSVPASGGTLVLPPTIAGQSSGGSIVFSEDNDQGAGYSVANCSLASGANFALGNTSATVPAGGSASIGVTGTAPTPGNTVTDTVTCDVTANGTTTTSTFTVSLAGLAAAQNAESVPTLSQWAMILMVLSLFGFGFIALRRQQ